MAQCDGARQSTGEYVCRHCRARWDADDDTPDCHAIPAWANPLAVRKKPLYERLTSVCESLRDARAPEMLIREIEDCVIELRVGSA